MTKIASAPDRVGQAGTAESGVTLLLAAAPGSTSQSDVTRAHEHARLARG